MPVFAHQMCRADQFRRECLPHNRTSWVETPEQQGYRWWTSTVRTVLREIDAGAIAKALVARQRVMVTDREWHLSDVFRRLEERFPTSYVYGALLTGGNHFAGAIPELLVSRTGTEVAGGDRPAPKRRPTGPQNRRTIAMPYSHLTRPFHIRSGGTTPTASAWRPTAVSSADAREQVHSSSGASRRRGDLIAVPSGPSRYATGNTHWGRSSSSKTARKALSLVEALVLSKLGLASRTQAALWAVREGLVRGA